MLSHFLHKVAPTGIHDIFDHLTEGIILVTPDGVIKELNQAAISLTHAPHSTCDQHLADLIPEFAVLNWQSCTNLGWQRLHPEGDLGKTALEYQVISLPAPSGTLTGFAILLRSCPVTPVFIHQHLAAIEASIDGIAIFNAEGNYLYLNPAHLKIFGYDRAEMLIGKSWQALYSLQEVRRFKREVLPQLRKTGKWRGESQGKRQDGSWFPQELSLTLIPQVAGGGFICICRDITERKQAEAALQESQQRFALAVEGSHDGLWDWDLQTDYAYLSPRWKEILGYRDDELPNTVESWKQSLYLEDQERVLAALNAYLAGQSPTYEVEFRGRHKEGGYRWILARGVALRDSQGKPYRMAGSHTDITERKEAEDALRQSQHFIQQIADATPTILYIYDLKQQRSIYVNRQIQVLLGYTPEEIQAMVPEFLLQLLHPEDIDQLLQHFHRIHQVDQPEILEVEYRVRDTYGNWHWFSSRDTIFRRTVGGEVEQILGAASDITERKHAEDSLRESESKFRRIFQDAPIGMAVADITGTLRQVNPAYCQLLGYTETELTQMTFAQITHPADLQDNLRNFQKLCHGEITHYELEKRYIHQQGHIIWVHLSVGLIFDQDGKIRYILGMVENITERKQIEEHLRLQKRAIAASSNGIVICDAQKPNLPITYVNPAFEKITGYNFNDIVGKNCRFLQRDDTQQPALNQLRSAVKAGENCTVIMRNYRQDGTLFWNELSISPIYDEMGKLTHFIGIQNDITERKIAENALLRTQARLQYLLASSPAILYTLEVTPPYRVTFVSNNAKILLGYDLAEVQKKDFWIEHIHPEERQQILEIGLKPLLEKGRYKHEYRFQHQDGSYRWIYDQLRLMQDADHRPLEIIGYWTDITELKQAESNLKASLQEKEVLLKEIHHRVKNNLQIISSLLKLQASIIIDPMVNALFQDSYNRVRSMALIHEKLYRTENLTLIDATDYIQSLVSNLLSSYGTQSLNLDLNIDKITLDIDTAIPCGLIITELVSNCLKYAFPQDQPGTLKIQFLNQGQFLTLSVSDNGIGFPLDFQPETSESLGLQLVVNLTEQLDGELDLDRNHGTCFTIKFMKPNP